jgi:rhodanese-related sulfurtransferase
LSELRDRLAELPRDQRIVVYCQKGQRGYLAACALKGSGFENVVNLRGGFAQARLNDFASYPLAVPEEELALAK